MSMSTYWRTPNRASVGVNTSTSMIPLHTMRRVSVRRVYGFISVMNEEGVEGPEIINVFGIGKREIQIGRGGENDIRVNSSEISRHHATMSITGDGHFLQAHLSNESAQTNSTRVSTFVIPQGKSVVVHDQSVFYLQGRRFKWLNNNGEVNADSLEQSCGKPIVYLFEESRNRSQAVCVSDAASLTMNNEPIPRAPGRRSFRRFMEQSPANSIWRAISELNQTGVPEQSVCAYGSVSSASAEVVTPQRPATPSRLLLRRNVRVRASNAIALKDESVLGMSALYKTVKENNSALESSQAASVSDAAPPIKNNESYPRTPCRRSASPCLEQTPGNSIFSASVEVNQTAVPEKSVFADDSVTSCAMSMTTISFPSKPVSLEECVKSVPAPEIPKRMTVSSASRKTSGEEVVEGTSSDVVVAKADNKVFPKKTRGRPPRPNVPGETSLKASGKDITEETNSEVVVAKADVPPKKSQAIRGRKMESPSPGPQTEQVPASKSKRSTRSRKQVEVIEATPQQQEKTDAEIPHKKTRGRPARQNFPDETSQNTSGEEVMEGTSSDVVVAKVDNKVVPKKTRGRPPKRTRGWPSRRNVPDETSQNASGEEVMEGTSSDVVVAKVDNKVVPRKTRGRPPKRTRGWPARRNVPDETSQNASGQEVMGETSSDVVVAKVDNKVVPKKTRGRPARRNVPDETSQNTSGEEVMEGTSSDVVARVVNTVVPKRIRGRPPKRTRGWPARRNVPDETYQNASGQEVIEETSSESAVVKADNKVVTKRTRGRPPKRTRGRPARRNVPDETSQNASGEEVMEGTSSEVVVAKAEVLQKKSGAIRRKISKMESPSPGPQTEQVPASESKRSTWIGKQVERIEATPQQQEKTDEEAENKDQVPAKRTRGGAPLTPQTSVPVVSRRARKEEPSTSAAMLNDEAVTKRCARKRKGEVAENKEGLISTGNVTEMMSNEEEASPPKKAKGRAVLVKVAREPVLKHSAGQAEGLVEVATQTEVLKPAVRKERAQTRRNQTANLTPEAELETVTPKGKKTLKQSKISKTPVEAETPAKQFRTRKVKFAEPQPEVPVVAPKLKRLPKKTVKETGEVSEPMELDLNGKRTRTHRNKIPLPEAGESNNELETSKRRLRGRK